MTPLEAARILSERRGPQCDGPIYYDVRVGKGRCGYCHELIPTNDHLTTCPVPMLPQIVSALEQGERMRALVERALPLMEDEWIGTDGPMVWPESGGEWIVDARAALHGQEAADATPTQDEMIPCPNGCLGQMGEGTYDDGTAGRPVPMYCGVNGCDVESPGMVYRE